VARIGVGLIAVFYIRAMIEQNDIFFLSTPNSFLDCAHC
jgi:hypothetical protein